MKGRGKSPYKDGSALDKRWQYGYDAAASQMENDEEAEEYT